MVMDTGAAAIITGGTGAAVITNGTTVIATTITGRASPDSPFVIHCPDDRRMTAARTGRVDTARPVQRCRQNARQSNSISTAIRIRSE